jgi:hypothetical protein
MKTQNILMITIVLCFQAVSMASLPSVPGLYGTGVDDLGNQLPVNSMDSHYVLTGPSSPAYVTLQAGTPRLNNTWWPLDNSAPWIGPQLNANQDAPSGDYVYTLTFDLTGFNLANMVISGQWSSDNGSSIYLNGVNTGFTTPYVPYPDGPFTYIYNFTLNSGFVPGLNTLEFHVYNESGPTGLLVQNLVPEPATLWALGLGSLVLKRQAK